jgi:hypothetical protein
MAIDIIENLYRILLSHRKEMQGTPMYQLSELAWTSIIAQAPGWKNGKGKSSITDAEIESQRQAFIKLHGNDGGISELVNTFQHQAFIKIQVNDGLVTITST